MFECAEPNCPNKAKSQCSVCFKEWYCGSECQKLDWKNHKAICPVLKKLSNVLQPFHEAQNVIEEIIISKKGKEVRVLEHLFLFAKHQFGERVVGLCYRERKGGERINNWNIEIFVVDHIIRNLARAYENLHSNDIEIRYLQQAVDILTPWLAVVDSDAKCLISVTLDEIKINYMLLLLSDIEYRLTEIAITKKQHDIAVKHCQRCLTYSQRYGVEGEVKSKLVSDALNSFSFLRIMEGNLESALTFAEDGYNLVAETFNPAHPKVQRAARQLIVVLISMGNLYDAERFSEITYMNLKDPANGIDPNSKEIAVCAWHLADVIFKQNGDLVKAEKLTRESLRIVIELDSIHSPFAGILSEHLAEVLNNQGKHTDENKELLERSLVIKSRNEGLISVGVARTNILIAAHHHMLAMNMERTDSLRPRELSSAKSYYEEGIRISSLLFHSTHPDTVRAASMLSQVLLML